MHYSLSWLYLFGCSVFFLNLYNDLLILLILLEDNISFMCYTSLFYPFLQFLLVLQGLYQVHFLHLTSRGILCWEFVLIWPYSSHSLSDFKYKWKAMNMHLAIPTTQRHSYTKKDHHKKSRESKCWWTRGEMKKVIHYWEQCKLVQPL